MNEKRYSMKRALFLSLVAVILFTSCKNNGNGELVGVQDRPFFNDIDPYGMVYVPAGHFLMGAGDEDLPYSFYHQPRNVTVVSFWMDETEVTNNEYRQFVNWVRDSIAHVLLGDAEITDVERYGHFKRYGKGHPEEGEVMEPRYIEWKEEIPWDSQNEEVVAALSPMMNQVSSRFYHYRPNTYNIGMFNYEFWFYDYRNQRDPDDPTSFGASYKEEEGSDVGGLFANRPSHLNGGYERFIKKEVVNVYPDTLCWAHDYTYSYNDPMVLNYYSHVKYDNYPVVGVSWRQAKAFAFWRTSLRHGYLGEQELANEQPFRLPSEAEWEWAARGDLDANKYPWGGNYTVNEKGCFLSNFKPQRGNYIADDNVYPAIVAHYHPNDFGLFDMSGNVAEWCEDAFDNSATNFTHDLNPTYTYYAKKEDSVNKKRKVTRGGSWKDIAYYTTVYTKNFEYQDSCKSFVGFRNVQTYLGRNRADSQSKSSHVY